MGVATPATMLARNSSRIGEIPIALTRTLAACAPSSRTGASGETLDCPPTTAPQHRPRDPRQPCRHEKRDRTQPAVTKPSSLAR
jgi:hypothetical protein